MNNDWLTQLTADEQPLAQELTNLATGMNMPAGFEAQLEHELMNTYSKKDQPTRGWMKFARPLGWALTALAGALMLTWGLRYASPIQPAAETVIEPKVPFALQVQQGDLCAGPLAVGHNFDISLSNTEKTGFIPVDSEQAIFELRSFTWSPDGKTLAVTSNTGGGGNVFLTDATAQTLTQVLEAGSMGYLMDVNWSHDGTQLVAWSSQNFTAVTLFNRDGTGLNTLELEQQLLATPQFGLNDQTLIFKGADATTAGLFEFNLKTGNTRVVSTRVEDSGGFAVSPDGKLLVFAAKDRTTGEMKLIREDLATNEQTTLGTLPIPTGSGSSLPEVANLVWSADGTRIAFEFGRDQAQRAIYLMQADGSGLTPLLNAAHTPAFSPDGQCLAYINAQKQVLVLSLADLTMPPLLLGDLPTGRAIASFKQDTLKWGR